MLEWDEWGNFKAWNIYGARADEILARYDTTYGALIYKQDREGNVVFLLDGSGNILERYRYDAFGQPAVTDWYGNDHGGASWYGNRFLFTGREYLDWNACYDYLGRFLQADPKGFDAGDMNLFRYTGDDPIDKTDPTGLVDIGRYSTLTCMGGGDWVKDSNGMTAWDFNQRGIKTTGMDAGLIQWRDEGNQNLHEPRVVGKSNGREYNAVTEPRLRTAVEDGAVILHYKIDVRYSDRVGPHNKEMQKKEPEHKQEIDKDFRFGRGLEIISALNRRGGPLDGASLEDARRMIDNGLQNAFNNAVDASRERHDHYDGTGRHGDHVIVHPDGLDY